MQRFRLATGRLLLVALIGAIGLRVFVRSVTGVMSCTRGALGRG
jgi:hypothetical protein